MDRLLDSTSAFDQFPTLRVGARLSEQLADALALGIRDGQLPDGERLPTESALVQRFGVSRTVVREALSRLKTLGLIESRQGSGAFVRRDTPGRPGPLLLRPDGSIDAVIQMVELRRALEAEAAGLAAARSTRDDVKRIKAALAALDKAVAAGGDGVAEDVAFHVAIATAARNPFLLATLSHLSQFLLDATRVTRANEATLAELGQRVRDEHAAIVAGIAAGDVSAARDAAMMHMVNAAERIGRADPVFWAGRGRPLADRLRADLGAAAPGASRKRQPTR
jgi:GntR family transcriptional regulator, transcriptional repressor for pyruvate dehydrogenase complex